MWRAYIAGRSRLGLGRAKAGSGSGEGHNAPLWKVWGLLRPTLASAFKDEFEMTLMLAICIVRYVELRLQTQVTRTLF